jgi:glycosyltransferase involved in cell wall biosynthesis
MVPVEAQACGRPVVALARGGALESVVNGTTGVLVDDASEAAFGDGLRAALSRDWDAAMIRRHAETFSKERFKAQFAWILQDPLDAAASVGPRPLSLADREDER